MHLIKYVNSFYDLFGIRTHKVRLLKKIMNKTGAKVVLSSSWRHGWYTYKEGSRSKRQEILHKKFSKYKIEVVGITSKSTNRNEEIKQYLNENLKISNFVVIDDETFNFDEEINQHLVKTSDTEMICGAWHENTGLKRKHVKRAIKILNNYTYD